jgi:hypothetical protein
MEHQTQREREEGEVYGQSLALAELWALEFRKRERERGGGGGGGGVGGGGGGGGGHLADFVSMNPLEIQNIESTPVQMRKSWW